MYKPPQKTVSTLSPSTFTKNTRLWLKKCPEIHLFINILNNFFCWHLVAKTSIFKNMSWAYHPKLANQRVNIQWSINIELYLLFWSCGLAGLERKLLSHICEDGERRLFSSVPISRLPPGIPEVSGNVREPPYRTDTDTPTFTGDYRRIHKVVRRTNQEYLLFVNLGHVTTMNLSPVISICK